MADRCEASALRRLELSAAAVESEFDAYNVGGVVGGKECHRCRVIATLVRWKIDDFI